MTINDFEEDALPTDPPALPTLSEGDGSKVYLLHYDEITRPGRCQKIVAVYNHKQTAHEAVLNICRTPESRRAFFDSFGHPQPEDIQPGNFWVEAFPLKRGEPLLDDWYKGTDGRYHVGWDHEAVLRHHDVTVEWGDKMVDGEGNMHDCPPELCGWAFSWKHGAIHVGQTTEKIARKASALFVRLWTLGVSASMADKLMDGYIVYLERQENKSLTFLVEPEWSYDEMGGEKEFSHMLITREGVCCQACLSSAPVQGRIHETLAPADDEEIIVTFTKRKRSGKTA